MNITHLKYAAEVAKTGSISQAAENLFMSQPNLSKAIKEFELSLGFTIFKRTSKGIEPTARGAEFLSYAENILTQIREMERIYLRSDNPRSEFSIAVPRASYITYAFTRFFAEAEPADSLEFNFAETNSMSVINGLVNGEWDVGIIRCRFENRGYFYRLMQDKGISHRRIFTYNYHLLISKEHDLAQSEIITPDMLGEYTEIIHGDLTVPFLFLPEGDPASGHSTCRRQVRVYERGSQFDILRRVKTTYMWVSPMPKEVLRNYGLAEKKSDDPNRKYCDILIYKKGHRFSENENQFLENLEEVIAEITR